MLLNSSFNASLLQIAAYVLTVSHSKIMSLMSCSISSFVISSFSLNSKLANLIIEAQVSGVALNAEAVISFPSGYTKANTRAVYGYLYISSATPRYPNAVDIRYIDDSGIHVKNIGGASGTVIVGIMQK